MRLNPWLVVAVEAFLVVGLLVAVAARAVPLGVPGEWEWLRVTLVPAWASVVLASAGVGVFASLIALGMRSMAAQPTRRLEAAWVAALVIAAAGVQVVVQTGAAPGYDLTKWAAVNYLPGSAGYFNIAREQAGADPWRFLAEYPEWISRQDSLHIGTHPPGLIVAQCVLVAQMQRHPAVADWLLGHMPAAVDAGFRVFGSHDPRPLTRADRAALYATALLTLAACASTVVPVYLLARIVVPAPAAWAAAALWPLAPAVNLFQPVADTAYPFLSASALALAAWSVRLDPGRTRSLPLRAALASAAGMVMAVGMAFTLAFLAVGLIVALVVWSSWSIAWRTRAMTFLAVGAGFLAVLLVGWGMTGADPWEIARWNLRNHARFYVEYPRTYRLWVAVNPLELAIALGLPTAVWCVTGFLAGRATPSAAWSTLVALILLDGVGRNLGEVARLWMLFMPALLVAAGVGVTKWGPRPAILGATAMLIGVQTLALQAMIQVVYPV